jgi:puromycin-sensitive aminopeptidase
MCILHAHEAVEVDSHRLPRDVVPRHYNVSFEPDLTNFTFKGQVAIDITVKKAVNAIVISAAELGLNGIALKSMTGVSRSGSVTYDTENETATISFGSPVRRGRYRLSMDFDGILNDKLHGFYRSFWKDKAGKDRVIASTQMEPADARRAFPCFDEPDFKATFGVTLVVDEGLMAVSNGRDISTKKLGNGKIAMHYKRTMKMATYIVAMVVGELVASRTVVSNGVKIRVIHTPGKEHLVDFALDAAKFAISFCEDYFGIKYPGDKLDLVAIPNFAFGAMENIGCMIFRETAVLIDPKTATIAEMMRVFEVVAHEIVHSWFGDLVTMRWWVGLWLNEAFATFISHKIVHAAHPEWRVWDAFAAGRRGGAMRTDGLLATRPIQAEVKRAADALGMVDAITYGKGSGALWQLEQFIGEDKFRDGVRVYLNRHSYGNTENDDLWEAIGSQTEQPVHAMMNSWIFQPGHPVVTVGDAAGGKRSRVSLSQQRFLYSEGSTDNAIWMVPVCLRYETESGVKTKWVLLDTREKSIQLGSGVKWVVANAGGFGFYRTRYASPVTEKISVSQLSPLERFNLVGDTWACVRAGLVTSLDYLAVIKDFTNETDPNVMGMIIDSLGGLNGVLPKANRPAFRAFVRELFTPVLERLGWHERDGESNEDKQLRGRVITTLGCTGKDEGVKAKALELFEGYLADKSTVSANVAPSLTWIAADNGDEAAYERFLSLYRESTNPQEKVRFLYALAYFSDEKLLLRTLAASITKDVQTQDAPNVLAMLLGSEIKTEAWKFVQNNWEHIVSHFPEPGVIGLVGSFASLNTPELEKEVQAFLATHTVRGGAKQVAQALENLRLAVSFRERERGRLVERFPAPVEETAA